MSITEHFRGNAARVSLERYRLFAQERNWSVEHKLDMYRAGAVAFDPAQSLRTRRSAFVDIYVSLRAGWQVFRNARHYWTAEQVFDVLTNHPACIACNRTSDHTVISLNENHHPTITACLIAIKDLKTLKHDRTSSMAMSKFLHFFNPKLFPIYDNDAVESVILRNFRDSWKSFQTAEVRLDIAYYYRYMLWVSTVMRGTDSELMRDFSGWFRVQVNGQELPPDLELYFPIAFEFIALGASLSSN